MAMATIPPPPAPASRFDDPGMLETLRNTVAKGANNSQLQMFIEVCKRTGLDPFLKEIWFVAEKGLIMAARDGYLRVANENPLFDGMETRVERDEKGIPIKAVCTVWRKDRTHPTTCEAYYSEYKKNSPVWSQYPSAMISKVAEVLALKRSFSINGVVSQEELGSEEERGSKEAQKRVLERKLQEKAEAKEAAAQAVPEPEGVHYVLIDPDGPIPEPPQGLLPPHDEELRDSLKAFPPKKKKGGGLSRIQIDMVKEFKPLHDGYIALGIESRYYDILGAWGVEKSTQFDPAADHWHGCLAEMKIDLQGLQKARQEAADGN